MEYETYSVSELENKLNRNMIEFYLQIADTARLQVKCYITCDKLIMWSQYPEGIKELSWLYFMRFAACNTGISL